MAEGKSHFKELLLVFLGLLVLTGITVYVAKNINFGSLALNITVALAIATLKATLVALYFMHLKWESKLIISFAVISIPFLILAIGIMVWDINNKIGLGNYNLQ
ncbi:MAG: cytochrome C oxidase subunit IV family protein [Leptospiraceae bacterium]|nr:cytochrome C oxidase subunit IV family protein [Leptospiraceae bacterium]